MHLPLLEAVLMSCGAQLAERSPSSSRHRWVSAACPAVHTGSGTQPDTHQGERPAGLADPPHAAPRHPRYLYFIPVSARTVSCRDSPCTCRNFSSCFSSAAPLAFPAQPHRGGQILGTTLGFLPFRSASLGFCKLGLCGGMSAQAGLYKCMVLGGAWPRSRWLGASRSPRFKTRCTESPVPWRHGRGTMASARHYAAVVLSPTLFMALQCRGWF